MKILAFDTSNNQCSVAILINNNIVSYNIIDESSKQAESLLILIEESLRKADLDYKDLNIITSTVGPGSFTGVRIGVAAAKGLQLVTNLPLIGISNLELIAFEAMKENKKNQNIISCLNARSEQFYYQIFSSTLKELSPPSLATLENLPQEFSDTDFIHAGDGFPLLKLNQKSIVNYIPNAKILAESISFFLEQKKTQEFAPLYIRGANITKAKSINRI